MKNDLSRSTMLGKNVRYISARLRQLVDRVLFAKLLGNTERFYRAITRLSTARPLLALVFAGFLCGCGRDRSAQLATQLREGDVESRRTAARALIDMQRDALPALSALREALGDSDPQVRGLASRALGEIGPEASSCLTPLRQALNDPQLSVRVAAALAIQNLDPSEKRHRIVLADAMKAGEGGTIVAIGRQGQRAAWAVST